MKQRFRACKKSTPEMGLKGVKITLILSPTKRLRIILLINTKEYIFLYCFEVAKKNLTKGCISDVSV